MDYGELARNVVESNGESRRVAALCDALGRDEDALLDALDEALLQHGDGPLPVASVRSAAAREWRNWGGNQVVHPTEQLDVATLKTAELQSAVRRARAENRQLKLGALCDEIRSVLLIDAEGQQPRLEPDKGSPTWPNTRPRSTCESDAT